MSCGNRLKAVSYCVACDNLQLTSDDATPLDALPRYERVCGSVFKPFARLMDAQEEGGCIVVVEPFPDEAQSDIRGRARRGSTRAAHITELHMELELATAHQPSAPVHDTPLVDMETQGADRSCVSSPACLPLTIVDVCTRSQSPTICPPFPIETSQVFAWQLSRRMHTTSLRHHDILV